MLIEMTAPPKPEIASRGLTAAEYLAHYGETSQPMELIEGEVFIMPAPRDSHAALIIRQLDLLGDYLKSQPIGFLRTSPYDVFLDAYNVVQPDILFVLHVNPACAIGEDGYLHGPPDLCIEILSPSTAKRDRGVKFELYERHGVREYWLVEPDLKFVEVYQRAGDHLKRVGVFDEAGEFECAVLPGLRVKVGEIFGA
jgi:Uma2 family endonuclease